MYIYTQANPYRLFLPTAYDNVVTITSITSLGKLMSKLQYHDHAKDDYGKDKQESNQSSIQKAKWLQSTDRHV